MKWIAGVKLIDVGLAECRALLCKLNDEAPPDVDRIPIAREAEEDRGAFHRRRNDRRTIGGRGSTGTGAGASLGTRPEGSAGRDAILDARPMVAPSISRTMPALRVEPLSSSSAKTQHRHGPGAAGLRR